MKLEIHVVKEGLYLKSPDVYEERWTEKINKSLITAGRYLLAELQKNSPVGATGSMRRGWVMDEEYRNTPQGRVVTVSIHNPLVYVEPTEYGRKASPVSKEGQKSIQQWVQRKLGKSPAESKSIAFLICRKKALFPTKGQRFIEKTLAYAMPKIVNEIAEEFSGDASRIDLEFE